MTKTLTETTTNFKEEKKVLTYAWSERDFIGAYNDRGSTEFCVGTVSEVHSEVEWVDAVFTVFDGEKKACLDFGIYGTDLVDIAKARHKLDGLVEAVTDFASNLSEALIAYETAIQMRGD